MAPHAWAAGWAGGELARQLAGWLPPPEAAAEPASAAPMAERLGGWLHWTDAIAVSGALAPGSGGAPTGPGSPPPALPPAPQAAAELEKLHRALTRAIDDPAGWRAASADGADAVDEADPSPQGTRQAAWRRHAQDRQRQMDTAIAPLRQRLRALLSARGGDAARLAALDAALDTALTPRERALLGHWPARLERAPRADAVLRPEALRELLQAELALRLAPLQALVAALHDTGVPPGHPSGTPSSVSTPPTP